MTKRNLNLLLVVALVLIGLFVLSENITGAGSSETQKPKNLFADIKGDKIAKFSIEKEGETVVLELKDDVWRLPERNYYRADFGKIRSLLLKLLDLNVSQLVTSKTDKFQTFGVDDAAVAAGKAKITFYDSSGKELAGVYLGEFRKGDPESPRASLGGQYVRRSSEDKVYLVSQSVAVLMGLKNWLDTTITNVLKNRIEHITQEKLSAGESSLTFELKKQVTPAAGGAGFELLAELSAGEEENTSSISTLTSGLENLRLTDVHTADSEKLAAVNWDSKTTFITENAIRYEVESAEAPASSAASAGEEVPVDEGSYYLKIHAILEESVAARLNQQLEDAATAKAEAEKAAAEKTAKAETDASAEKENQGKEDEGKENEGEKNESAKNETAKVETAAVAVVQPATAEDVEKLNAEFSKWVYEVPKYVAAKFRYGKSDVIQQKTTSSE